MRKPTKNAKQTLRRATALLVSLVLLTAVFQNFIFTAFATNDIESVVITRDGEVIDSLLLPQNERLQVTAVASPNLDGTSYQWQVLADIKSDLWVNIYDGKSQNMTLSYALLGQVLDESGSAYVRVRASAGGNDAVSDPLCVTISYNIEDKADNGFSASVSAQSASAKKAAKRAAVATYADESSYIDIKINYLDAASKLAIYTSYTAQIQRGTAYSTTVSSPTYLGYAPFYNQTNPAESDPDNALVSANDVPISIGADYSESTYTVNVYYKAVKVPYSARYFFQNINDDLYTENVGLYYSSSAYTGTIISNEDLEDPIPENARVGFTKLYHYPQAVAADGSTIFECYYDRNYALLKFDLDGGYGTDPIYARYGTPFFVNQPTRHGYVFKGWHLVSENESDDEKNRIDDLPSTVPAESQSYIAIWEKVDTTYTVAYWLQNADDDDYSYVDETQLSAKSGDTVTVDSLKYNSETGTGVFCENTDATHVHTDACNPLANSENDNEFKEHFKHFIYDEDKTLAVNESVTVEGNGSTVLNIYYTRKYYTLRFIYAKEYNTSYDNKAKPSSKYINYQIVGGSTHGFGHQTKNWPNNNNRGGYYSLDELISNIGNQWGTLATYNGYTESTEETLSSMPQVKGDQASYYEFGVYPAAGEGYNGSDYIYTGDRFFYFDLTARYDADLTDKWPVDPFGVIQMQSKTSQGKNYGWGDKAYLAGWNGEFKIQYSVTVNNPTIKGKYQKLDDNLLLYTGKSVDGKNNDYDFRYTEVDSNGNQAIERIVNKTVGSKEVTSYVTYFMAFYENGANFTWSIPRQWTYECYVPIFTDELTDEQKAEVLNSKAEVNGSVTYVPCEINGKTYYYYETNKNLPNEGLYRLYDKTITCDDNRTIHSQTQPSITGFEINTSIDLPNQSNNANTIQENIEYDSIKNARAERITTTGTLDDDRESYTARFFYTRTTPTLMFHNHNKTESTYSVEFDKLLDSYIEANKAPTYPSTLEEGAYTFGGWYYSPDCLDGSEYKAGTKMPSNNVSLYAKWGPNTYTVNFFLTYDDMLAFEASGGTRTDLLYGEPRKVAHGNVAGSVNTPKDANGVYAFTGWFYIKAGSKAAYTPLDIPVTHDMNVFADWGSQIVQPYRIHYARYLAEGKDKNDKNSAEWLALLDEASAGAPADNRTYTVEYGGEERTYVWLASDGSYHRTVASDTVGFAYQGNTHTFMPKAGDPLNQLYTDFNSGYYPTVASHSMVIRAEKDEDKDDPKENVFTFTYVYAENISYRVEYRYADDSSLITDAPGTDGKGYIDKLSSKSVVTERFAVIKNYIPDAFYKRLILAVELDENGNVISSPDNVVTFYYSKNTVNAFYAVHHMLQTLDAAENGRTGRLNSDGSLSDNYVEMTATTEGIGDIGKIQSIVPQTFGGFTVESTAIEKTVDDSGTASTTDKTLVKSDDANHTSADGTVSTPSSEHFDITVSANGTELYIFYTRNKQEYKVYHLEYGTDVSDLSKLEYTDGSNGVLAEIESNSDRFFGSTVEAYAKDITGMNCVSLRTQRIVLSSNNGQNYMIFYYAPLQYTVEYKVWKYGGGDLSQTIEVKRASETFSGSVASAKDGYTFVGWYLDEDCTQPASEKHYISTDPDVTGENNKVVPNKDSLTPMPAVNVLYAKFTPSVGKLTIKRENGNTDEGRGNQTFVYRITAADDPSYELFVSVTADESGAGEVTIKDMVARKYKVEQVDSWSWRYNDAAQEDVTVTVGGETAVTFGKGSPSKETISGTIKGFFRKWLTGNSSKVTNTKSE